MANINDYVLWRGDLTLDQSPLNEIDNMILSRFSYLPINKIAYKKIETMGDICKKVKDFDVSDFNMPGDKILVKNIIKSNRFKDMKVTDYEENTDVSVEKQFAAITIHLGNGEIYVSYCGTDSSIIGWKEDFNLSFMQHIPAQLEGVSYLKRIAEKYPDKIHIGGHSKGGNVAVYSAVFAGKRVQNRIIDVTNHDGPGFDEDIILSEEYQRILNKIRTYIPQSSVVGRLLDHEEKYKVVKSIEKGIMQHDIHSWQVLGTKIVQLEEVTNGSELINKTIRNWLKETTPEQRKEVIDMIFEIIESTNAISVHEISTTKMKSLATMMKSYNKLESKDKKMINEVIKQLGIAAKNSIKEKFVQEDESAVNA